MPAQYRPRLVTLPFFARNDTSQGIADLATATAW
jgi:hypothetical protein